MSTLNALGSTQFFPGTTKTPEDLQVFLSRFYVTFMHLECLPETQDWFYEMLVCLNTFAYMRRVQFPAHVVKELGQVPQPYTTKTEVNNAFNVMGIEYKFLDAEECRVVLKLRPYIKKLLEYDLLVLN